MMSCASARCALRVNELTVGIMMSLFPLVTSTGCVIFFKSAYGSPPDFCQAAIATSWGEFNEGTYRTARLFILSCLIFKSSVERGIPSLAAAPFGPATFPLVSARAASISSFS
jgi:hypothetical protein